VTRGDSRAAPLSSRARAPVRVGPSASVGRQAAPLRRRPGRAAVPGARPGRPSPSPGPGESESEPRGLRRPLSPGPGPAGGAGWQHHGRPGTSDPLAEWQGLHSQVQCGPSQAAAPPASPGPAGVSVLADSTRLQVPLGLRLHCDTGWNAAAKDYSVRFSRPFHETEMQTGTLAL
jgi:hypothetical protein